MSLREGSSELLETLDPGSFDAIVVNSVVQLFPGMEAVARLVRGAARVLAPGGFLFLGDVRDFKLL